MVDQARERGGLLCVGFGPHGLGYRLAGSPVSCRQLDADASTVSKSLKVIQNDTVK